MTHKSLWRPGDLFSPLYTSLIFTKYYEVSANIISISQYYGRVKGFVIKKDSLQKRRNGDLVKVCQSEDFF